MEWVKALAGTVVAIDTAPLIYFIEKHPRYLATIDPFFDSLDRGLFQAITSTVTLTEVLVLPLRVGNDRLVSEYMNILTKSRNITLLPVSEAIAARAAQLRASARLRMPDAIQIATAQVGGAAIFITNDEQLVPIQGIAAIVLERMATMP